MEKKNRNIINKIQINDLKSGSIYNPKIKSEVLFTPEHLYTENKAIAQL